MDSLLLRDLSVAESGIEDIPGFFRGELGMVAGICFRKGLGLCGMLPFFFCAASPPSGRMLGSLTFLYDLNVGLIVDVIESDLSRKDSILGLPTKVVLIEE